MKRLVLKILMVLSALLSALLLITVCFFVSRNTSFIVPYLCVPIAILIWSIMRYRRRSGYLFLTFGISFAVSAVVLLLGFLALIAMALTSFT